MGCLYTAGQLPPESAARPIMIGLFSPAAWTTSLWVLRAAVEALKACTDIGAFAGCQDYAYIRRAQRHASGRGSCKRTHLHYRPPCNDITLHIWKHAHTCVIVKGICNTAGG